VPQSLPRKLPLLASPRTHLGPGGKRREERREGEREGGREGVLSGEWQTELVL